MNVKPPGDEIETPARCEQQVVDAEQTGPQAALRAQIDAHTVPSGILIEGPADGDLLDAFDGSESSPVADPLQWRHAWDLFQRSRVSPLTAHDVSPETAMVWAGNAVPIVIADLSYERARPRLVAALTATGAHDLSSLVRPGHAFIAAALLPERMDVFTPLPGRHAGFDVAFVFGGHLGNVNAEGASYTLDPGDGRPHPFSPTQTVHHRYAEAGVHILTLRAHDPAGQVRVAHLSLVVQPRAPKPDDIWSTGAGPLDCAYVYRGRPGGQRRTQLEQPVLISDGFPGHRDIHELWPLFNQSRFVDTMLDAGKDVILIGYQDGKKPIGESAKQYIAVIERALRERVGSAPLVVGGASMGGLIARYALCQMESEDRPHQTRLFFTVDTPHNGANIPTSVQAFVQLWHDHNETTIKQSALINSPAAQQMLAYWIPPRAAWRDGVPFPQESPLRQEFLKDLRRLGWMPRKVERKVAVADGLGDGRGPGVPGGAKAFWFECTIFAWADMWATQDQSAPVLSSNRGLDRWLVHAGGQRIDSAPGGTSNTWVQMFDGVGQGVRRDIWHRTHCFVPTASACAIAGNLHAPIDVSNSEFDAIACSTTENRPHVDLHAELKNFLVAEIAGAPATGPVVPWLPIHHPDCLRGGDEVVLSAPNGHVFRRDPSTHDGMVARDGNLFRDARLVVAREGADLCFRSPEPTPRWIGRVQRDHQEQPYEASKEATNEWTRVTPTREAGPIIRLRSDIGRNLVAVQRPYGQRLEANGAAADGILVARVEHTLVDGDVLALQASNGRFVSRMGENWGRPIAATKPAPDMHCRFVVRLLGGNRVALRNEGTHYIKVMTREGVTRIEAVSEELDAYGIFVLEFVRDPETGLPADNRITLKGFGDSHVTWVDHHQEIRPGAAVTDPRSHFAIVLLERGS